MSKLIYPLTSRLVPWVAAFTWVVHPIHAQPQTWRAFIVQQPDGVEIVTSDGHSYPAQAPHFPEEAFGLELEVTGRLGPNPSRPNDHRETLFIDWARPTPPRTRSSAGLLSTHHYARTSRTLPEDELLPGRRIELDLPELGKSATSRGAEPIKMVVDLPQNYRQETAHPVIIHFGGGRGGTGGTRQWRQLVGPLNFILIAADYDHHENERRGLLEYGTCRDENGRIALHALQIVANSTPIDAETVILAGTSSGAYNITDLFFRSDRKAVEPFSGFCAIAGGAGGPNQTRLGDKPVLLIMGSNDRADRLEWLNETVEQLRRSRAGNVTVEIVPDVGHRWSPDMTPFIQKWLSDHFPTLGAVERRRHWTENAPSPAIKTIVEEWMQFYGLE